ncbi:hypothetical protein AMAG_03045 [Allomyces macrogynus ATCC 38327]|uniref:Translin n=1 Tax=Allomyces macrogynus (strain ATCC 38327) TaxID=578462 RepID=A0A0L0S438_ALLM3|nr:hypothetical protein AMAG_03045 [Allomyces macrogynus ATCC 38327]|eukprot:KNE57322.1 hypothetical protein AMAG_03045 [Allomyces macrogynus ATCC 38327]
MAPHHQDHDNDRPSKRAKVMDTTGAAENTMAATTVSSTAALFQLARGHLDAQWNQREAVIKQSREITRESKKLIVMLQRHDPKVAFAESEMATFPAAKAKVLQMLSKLAAQFKSRQEFHRYSSNVKHCIQEFLEAVAFHYFLEFRRMIPFDDARLLLESLGLQLMPQDYIMGISDVSGEVMRFATNAATKGNTQWVEASRTYLQDFYHACLSLDASFNENDMNRKIDTTRESVLKVERLAYDLAIRQSEQKLFRKDLDVVMQESTAQ